MVILPRPPPLVETLIGPVNSIFHVHVFWNPCLHLSFWPELRSAWASASLLYTVTKLLQTFSKDWSYPGSFLFLPMRVRFNGGLKWTATSEFGTYRLCEQRRFRRACASAQSRQNLRCSLIQAVSQEEPSVRKPDPWPLWMAGHAQLKFVMTECSKTQIRFTGPKWYVAQHYKTNQVVCAPS